MMLFVYFLTFLLMVDCLLLILLVLIQLPKKEAGMAQAFGGGTTDALFGPGSGTALTKLTKYATGIFFVLTLCISILYSMNKKGKTGFEKEFQKSPGSPPAAAPAVVPPLTNVPAAASTNAAAVTNAPAAAVTNVVKPPTNAPPATGTPAPAPAATNK